MEICPGVLRKAVVEGRLGDVNTFRTVTPSVLPQFSKYDRGIIGNLMYRSVYCYDCADIFYGESAEKKLCLLICKAFDFSIILE